MALNIHHGSAVPAPFAVDFAGLKLGINVNDQVISRCLQERYQNFVGTWKPQWTIHFDVVASTPDFLVAVNQVHPEPVEVARTERGFLAAGSTYQADFDFDSRQVHLRGPCAAYPVDGALRLLLPLLTKNGLLVHGGMLMDGERAWAISGPSGAGKSTLCQILAPYAYCDELVAVKREEGGWIVESMPFWVARPARSPLDALFILRHGVENRKTRCAPSDAMRHLMDGVMWPIASEEAIRDRFDLLTRLVDEVDVWELCFAPDGRVWETIRGSQ